MPTYRFTLHSGQVFTAEDKRDLKSLSADLCSVGFVVLQRRAMGYSTELKSVAVLERAVALIEPAE